MMKIMKPTGLLQLHRQKLMELLHGSIDDVRQTLVAFAASDRKNDEHCYEHGCKSVDDVIDSSDGCGWLFSAYSTYDNYHIDYQAIRVDHIQSIRR